MPLAAIAKECLPMVSEDRDAENFLKDLSERTGINKGYKGGLSLWGYVGNHSVGERFVDVLRPFWYAVFKAKDEDGDEAILLSHEHILVFVEEEQSEQAQAYEIMLDDADTLVIKHHQCPFSWGQY